MSIPIAAGRAVPTAPPIIRSKAASAGTVRDAMRPNPLVGEGTTTPTIRPRGPAGSALTTGSPTIAVNPVIRTTMSIRMTAAAMTADAVTVTTKR